MFFAVSMECRFGEGNWVEELGSVDKGLATKNEEMKLFKGWFGKRVQKWNHYMKDL